LTKEDGKKYIIIYLKELQELPISSFFAQIFFRRVHTSLHQGYWNLVAGPSIDSK
jgi:hypothetical protein